MHSQTATVHGITMRWLEQGEGLPVVLLHGIPTSPALWRHVMPKLEGVRCLAFEMVGYGDSIPAGAGQDLSISHQAEYLAQWMDHLGIERAVLVGHDLGGGVAQIAAVRRPELCAGLLLTNAIGYDSWPIPSVKALNAGGPLISHLPGAAGKQILRVLMHRGHDNKDMASEALEEHWQPYARHGGAASLIRQIEALDVHDTLAIQDALPGLAIPARIVWGAADPFQKIEYGERFARDLSAPLHRIEGGLHFTPEDHPGILAEQILRLVDEVRHAAAPL
ncbi:Pimeloyl-ACP methyl ester carboxylesterase [Halopseudomonas xinjiangensis]|uniref:Pimeloyl-ACP methyl ester carboxylesterase n=1 Tax=Halopseudomonas xinjiangensis TaxID=487184 RepID=A0A1H1TY82_9GAMM|nr:alpha/beta fold hydrolase [Halopseudomonas xinjiangensis]SDS64559.1 Pimeloyl-ACP methyl ester carboxylesterase [Halopseudomonas xinjiangensis]